jgi:hypothetical protein
MLSSLRPMRVGEEKRNVDSPLHVVTIMNYPPESKYRRMCYIFLDRVIAHGARRITILYEKHRPIVTAEHRRLADIEVRQERSYHVGHPHFNLRFKLPNLARLDFPFLFLDSDMVVLDDLDYLWRRRQDKPWMGIDHQVVPSDVRTHRSPFLNSGLQLVSDPSFYDLQAILAAQNAAAPLNKHQEMEETEMFPCPGRDQAVLFRYFRTVGYDYTHPEIGFAWNSCAGVTEIGNEQGVWKARSHSQSPNYEVSIVHYWDQFKPWRINCPIYQSYAWVDDRLRPLS